MKYFVQIDGRTFEVEIDGDEVRVDGRPLPVELRADPGSGLHHLLIDGRSRTLRLRRLEGRGAWEASLEGRAHRVVALDERRHAIRDIAGAAAGTAAPLEVRAPMPGLIVAVEVAEGDAVERGQGLVIIEAMKMENELKAETAGRVAAIRVAPGEPVERGETLLVIERSGQGESMSGPGGHG